MGNPTIEISEARKALSHMDERLAVTPVIDVTRHGRLAFHIVQIAHLESILETLEILSDPDTINMLRESQVDIEAGRLIGHDEILRQFG